MKKLWSFLKSVFELVFSSFYLGDQDVHEEIIARNFVLESQAAFEICSNEEYTAGISEGTTARNQIGQYTRNTLR